LASIKETQSADKKLNMKIGNKKWFVQLNRYKAIGYYADERAAQEAATLFKRYGYPKAKATLEFR
jgi:hypothetical protein